MVALTSMIASFSLCFSSVAVHPPSTKRLNGPFFFLACVTRPVTVCGLPCFVLVPARNTPTWWWGVCGSYEKRTEAMINIPPRRL
jgi:hypothetical protein